MNYLGHNNKSLVKGLENYFFELKEKIIIYSKSKSFQNSDYYPNTFKAAFIQLSDENLAKITYTPLAFYWANLCEKTFILEDAIDTCSQGLIPNVEEELFDLCTNSEWGNLFFKHHEKSQNVQSAAQELLTALTNQILGFYNLHFLQKKSVSSYRPLSEIGDHLNYILIGDQKDCYKGKVNLDSLQPIDLNNFQLTPISPLRIDEKIIWVLSQDHEIHKKKITKALEIIKSYSFKSYNNFFSYTHSIIPIDQKDVVSFSSQDLPGYSSINMYERDFIDLIDDLIHENGHHMLNHLLYLEDLIEESDEYHYFSPWRGTMRPVRGIYHGYFTFYQGLELFYDISTKLIKEDEHKLFTDEEIEKIYTRFGEEYLKLSFCHPIIKAATKHGMVTKRGYQLFKQIREQVIESKEFFEYLRDNEFLNTSIINSVEKKLNDQLK